MKDYEQLRTELPTRLSHRLRDLQSLPFGVASHPRIEHVMELYLEAFEGCVSTLLPLLSCYTDSNARTQHSQVSAHQRP
jgi:hypothetical protein